MKIFKRSLAALLALTMAFSSMALSVFAEGEEDLVVAQEMFADKGVFLNYTNTAVESGYYGANGYAATAEEAGEGAVGVKYVSPDLFSTLNEVVWGVELQQLDVKDYTFTAKIALIDPEGNEDESSLPLTALAPKVRDQVSGSDVYDPVILEYFSIDQLRDKMDAAKAAGDQFITISVPIKVEDYTANADSGKIKIECRLSSPYRAIELGNNINGDLPSSTGLVVRSFLVTEGAKIVDGMDPATGIYYENGAPAVNKLVGNATNGYYYTDANGKIRTNYAAEGYYFGKDGRAVTNTVVGGYYYAADGKKPATQLGVKMISGKYYYVKAGGAVAVNQTIAGKYYGADGAMVTNKIFNGKGYDAMGNQIKNKVAKVGGKLYAFDANGNLIKNKKNVKVGSKRTATNADGSVTVNKKYGSYITNASGYLIQNGVKKIGKTTYAVKNYKVVTGTKIAKIGSKSYAVKKGKVVTGKVQIVKIGKKSYAVKKTGQLYGKTKKLKVGKKTYTVAKNGVAKVKK